MSNNIPNDFTIVKQTIAGGVKFEAAGFINMNTAVDFEKALDGAVQAGEKSIILDMGKVVALTSFGVRVILKTYKATAAKGGKFQIENPSPTILAVLKISNLEQLLVK